MSGPGGQFDGVYVVIAAFNEAQVIAATIRDVAGVVPAGQVIVVDDASTDATADLAGREGVRVLRHAINRGQGAALATGVQAALSHGAKIVVTFDADGQHVAGDIPAVIAPLLAGEAQVVLGTRFFPGGAADVPARRRLMLRLAVCFTRLVSRLPVTDAHNGFRALTAQAAAAIVIREDRMAHASEILDEIRRHKLSYVERPVHIRYSAYSLAKGQKNRAAFKLALTVLWGRLKG
jgi:glycosyltransferase involved in cell wall biosynthesis